MKSELWRELVIMLTIEKDDILLYRTSAVPDSNLL